MSYFLKPAALPEPRPPRESAASLKVRLTRANEQITKMAEEILFLRDQIAEARRDMKDLVTALEAAGFKG